MSAEEPRKPDQQDRQRIIELRTSQLCRKRYGRATLTISPAGTLGAHGELAEAVEAYRSGKTDVQSLLWAFARTRVIKHSPSFSWDTADLARLLPLILDCSDEPHFESAEPEVVASAIVTAHDKENEQLREMSQMFSRSFLNATMLTDILPSTYLGWADQQRRSFDAIYQMIGAGQLTQISKQLGEMQTAIGIGTGAAALGVTSEFVTQMGARSSAMAGAITQASLLNATLDLRKTPLFELSRSFTESAATLTMPTLGLASREFLNRPTATVAEVLDAADEAAEAIAEGGAEERASELRAVTAEVRDVAANPSTERLEEMLGHLTGLVEEESRARQRDARDALMLNLFLFFLSVYLAIFLWLLGVPVL
jgi:hypothetical protein